MFAKAMKSNYESLLSEVPRGERRARKIISLVPKESFKTNRAKSDE